MATIQAELEAHAVAYTLDPEGWVDYAYDWGRGELANERPRAWQRRQFRRLRKHLQNRATRHQPFQLAISSGHGIGKSAFLGQLVNWAMSTCPRTKIVVTANTATQLRTKTSPEILKWNRLSITGHWFDGQVMSVVHQKESQEWRCDLMPWSEHNTEAFQGLHNKKRRIVLIFDEGSAIPDKVWEVAEGALTDEFTEIIWVVCGNPTRNSGRFRECFRKNRKSWHHEQIDSRSVEGTNKEYLARKVEEYGGEEADKTKIRIRGVFPAMGVKQLISTDDLDAAFGRAIRKEQFSFAPVILGVDPAWEGDDDLVITLRQGLFSKILRVLPKNDNDIEVAQLIANLEERVQADAVFVDAGYGTGIVSAGRTMGRAWQLIWFSGGAADVGNLNKRAEMWVRLRDWLKAGGCLPPDQQLYDELVSMETVPRLDGKIQLEDNVDYKKRVGCSPDRASALALTFAHPVSGRRTPGGLIPAQAVQRNQRYETEYNPFEGT